MIGADASTAASPDRLWAVCSDVTSWPQHLDTFTAVESLSGGPTRVGSRFAVTQPGLPDATYEVTQWEPGEAFTWVAKSRGVRTTAIHRVVPTTTGSRIELEIRWSGPMAGLVRMAMTRKSQRMIETEAVTFAHVAEST